MTVRKISASILVAFFLALGSTCWAEQLDGHTLLKRMLSAEGTVAFTAHQITTLARGPSVTSEQIIYRDGFKGMRTEYLQPPSLAGEVMADDGRTLMHLIPKSEVVRVGSSRLRDLKARTEQSVYASTRGHIKAELVGKDRIANRSAYVVQVRPQMRKEGPTRKFWIDAEKWIKLKTEDITPAGAVLSMSYYTRVTFVDGIARDKFRIETPAGYRVERHHVGLSSMSLDKARKNAGFKLLEPSKLPPGFKAMNASFVPFRGGKLVVMRYTDGVTSLSLFQTKAKNLDRKFLSKLHEGPVQPSPGMYAWRRSDVNLTLIGQLSTEQLREIAASVK